MLRQPPRDRNARSSTFAMRANIRPASVEEGARLAEICTQNGDLLYRGYREMFSQGARPGPWDSGAFVSGAFGSADHRLRASPYRGRTNHSWLDTDSTGRTVSIVDERRPTYYCVSISRTRMLWQNVNG